MGSGGQIKRRVIKDLWKGGLKAESLFDDRVWAVKGHLPERIHKDYFSANKCLLIVRNPFDAIYSCFHHFVTGTHDCTVTEKEMKTERVQEIFNMFLDENLPIWRDFHSYWLEGDPQIPTYVIRYEDIL